MSQRSFYAWLLLLLLTACGPVSKLNRENLSTHLDYNFAASAPDYTILHVDSDTSVLVYRIPVEDVLRKNTDGNFYGKLKLHFALMPGYNQTSILDSGSFIFTVDSGAQELTGNIKFKISRSQVAVMRIDLTDVYRNFSGFRFVDVDKSESGIRQFFSLYDENDKIKFNNFIYPDQQFNLRCFAPAISDSFYVSCYYRNFPLAAPPFKEEDDKVFSMIPDSVFAVSVADVSSLRLHRYGFLHFKLNKSDRNGFTLFVLPENFPIVNSASQLIESTRYITTAKEHKELMASAEKKKALDNFWLSVGGNANNAKALIREYYSRVQHANRLFSSYLEGWRTDRGMIYIIFGEPQSVYRSNDSEQWTYSTMVNSPDLVFAFKRVGNPFSNNDYSLIRQLYYENAWYMSVDQWRQGRAVNSKE
jgi:GWxTD domain-containing protein